MSWAIISRYQDFVLNFVWYKEINVWERSTPPIYVSYCATIKGQLNSISLFSVPLLDGTSRCRIRITRKHLHALTIIPPQNRHTWIVCFEICSICMSSSPPFSSDLFHMAGCKILFYSIWRWLMLEIPFGTALNKAKQQNQLPKKSL